MKWVCPENLAKSTLPIAEPIKNILKHFSGSNEIVEQKKEPPFEFDDWMYRGLLILTLGELGPDAEDNQIQQRYLKISEELKKETDSDIEDNRKTAYLYLTHAYYLYVQATHLRKLNWQNKGIIFQH